MPPGICAVRYESSHEPQWNAFVDGSKTGVFLFRRDYMDYHSDRFADASLLFYEGERLIALLPANLDGDTLASHGGLTFGGLVSGWRMRTATMVNVVAALRHAAREMGAARILYKAVPHIYHRAPAEEDLYALFVHEARLVRRDVSSTIRLDAPVRFSKGRKWALKQAEKHGVEVGESRDYERFLAIEARALGEKYGVEPVHTAGELELLSGRFPHRIRLFTAFRQGEMLGGVVVYAGERVAHAQYIGATDEGKHVGALDAVLAHLILEVYSDWAYFDFGISTERAGRYLNIPLIENKEGFGARATVYDFYEIDAA